MNIILEHNLGQEKAVDCAKKILDELKEEHGDKVSNLVQVWTGNSSKFSFRVSGISISGEIIVTDKTIEIKSKLPLAALVFQSLVEENIKKHSKRLIDKCAEKNNFL